jgi:hypothetical protein
MPPEEPEDVGSRTEAHRSVAQVAMVSTAPSATTVVAITSL